MIHVISNYYIDADDDNFTLLQKVKVTPRDKTKEPTEKFKLLGYYSTIESCVSALLTHEQQRITGSEELELSQALEKFRGIRSEVLEAVRGAQV